MANSFLDMILYSYRRYFFISPFIFIFIVQALSSEIVKQTKVCANIFKECKGMEDQALAYVDR